MKFDTATAADYAEKKLTCFLERAERDTQEALEDAHISTIVIHFAEFRERVRALREKVTALQQHIDMLSHEALPTMFANQNIDKTIFIKDVGRTTIVDDWSAKVLNKARAFDWLRDNKAEGLIIETINSQTLAAFAKRRAIDGQPLPAEIFQIKATPYVSITKD